MYSGRSFSSCVYLCTVYIPVLCIFIYVREKETLSCLTAAIISTLRRQIINNLSEFMIKLIVSVFLMCLFRLKTEIRMSLYNQEILRVCDSYKIKINLV